MPKISAPTVKEHHETMFERLVDAAEEILREDGAAALTAGQVAEKAGIARNSIYRYVDSVDDFRIHVLERYIPVWIDTVRDRVDDDVSPRTQLEQLIDVSLDLADRTGHGWLIDVMTTSTTRGRRPTKSAPKRRDIEQPESIDNFHRELAERMAGLWADIEPERAELLARMTSVILQGGMTMLDAGLPLADVKGVVLPALRGLTHASK